MLRFNVAVEDGKLRPPFNAIAGLGDNAALLIEKGAEGGRFISREEFVSDATVEKVMLDPIWHFCPTEFNEDTARQLLGEVYDQKLY